MTRTLLVDGNSLLNTGFHGIKNMYNGTDHIGGLYHFLNTLRKLIDVYLLTKIVVCWDGEHNTKPRLELYPDYKLNRRAKPKSEDDLQSYARQKLRVQEYLEELYVRQATFKWCEADDCIAHYCEKATKEETTKEGRRCSDIRTGISCQERQWWQGWQECKAGRIKIVLSCLT